MIQPLLTRHTRSYYEGGKEDNRSTNFRFSRENSPHVFSYLLLFARKHEAVRLDHSYTVRAIPYPNYFWCFPCYYRIAGFVRDSTRVAPEWNPIGWSHRGGGTGWSLKKSFGSRLSRTPENKIPPFFLLSRHILDTISQFLIIITSTTTSAYTFGPFIHNYYTAY